MTKKIPGMTITTNITTRGVLTMGMAKYHEDILEIVLERMDNLNNRTGTREVVYTRSTRNTPSEYILEPICNNAEPQQTKTCYVDRHIMCWTCGNKFLFSAHSQKYFASQNWEDPKRCKCCREARNRRYLLCASF